MWLRREERLFCGCLIELSGNAPNLTHNYEPPQVQDWTIPLLVLYKDLRLRLVCEIRIIIMSSYSRRKLNRIISIGALSFPVAVLICLAIVFVGCTSPFSPFNLYFMKVSIACIYKYRGIKRLL